MRSGAPIEQLERRPDGTTRFLAQAGLMGGRWFSVHDVDQGAGRVRKVALSATEATHRMFVQADKGVWAHAFAPREGRGLEIPALERQLQAAHYTQPRAAARDGR